MSTRYIITGIALMSIFLGACKKNFLDTYPTSTIVESNFFKDENQLKNYTNNLYTYINNFGHSTGTNLSPLVQGDNQSDNLVPSAFNLIVAGKNIIPASDAGTWNWTFIRSCNYFLARYGITPISTVTKNIYGGEARFFKAWEYFEKVKKYGDVPWLTTDLTVESPELYAGRTSRQTVMDSIVVTVDSAIAQLPAKASAAIGRINKDMALLLKARICLYEGTYRKYRSIAGSDVYLQKAVAASDQLINEAHYTIYNTGKPTTDYPSLFNSLDLSTNKEIILYKDYKTGLQGNGTSWNLQNNNFTFSVSKSLINSYLCLDGKPISQSAQYLGDDSVQREMQNRDNRLQQTVTYPKTGIQAIVGGITAIPGYVTSSAGVVPTGYQVTKYWVADQTEYLRIQNGLLNAPIFRYAEVLLISAEANAELNQCTQAIIDKTINVLRARAGVQPMTISSLVKDSKSDFPAIPVLTDEIRRERRVELAVEALRWDDIVRWKAGYLLNNPVLGMKFVQSQYPKTRVGTDIYLDANGYILPYFKSLPAGRSFDETKGYLLPLPIDELQINPNLKQNPNW